MSSLSVPSWEVQSELRSNDRHRVREQRDRFLEAKNQAPNLGLRRIGELQIHY